MDASGRPGGGQLLNRNHEVDDYLDGLSHPLKTGITDLRLAILAANPEITEHVKWNALSFCHRGVDRLTFRLKPADQFQLIFHRGPKVQTAGEFAFVDHTGLIRWLAPDRGVIDLPDLGSVAAHGPAIVSLVRDWVAA